MFEVADAVKGPPRIESVEGTQRIDSNFLFENVICDLYWSALHIATLCTLLNAIGKANTQWTLRPWRHLLYDNSKIMLLALRYSEEIGLSAEAGGQLSGLYSEMAVAKKAMHPLTSSVKNYTPSELMLATKTAAKWRQLSQTATQVMNAIEPVVKNRLPGPYSADARTLVGFLRDAATGDTKRVSPAGEISLPALNQRRKAPRIAVDRPCRLLLPSLTLSAKLEDVSSHGLGVICGHAFPKRQPLTVELDDGRLLKATVVRQNGDRVGLSLARPLANNDPLFVRSRAKATSR